MQTALKALGESKHVRPIVDTDLELQFVEEREAPGISEYRRHLFKLFRDRHPISILQDQIISKLDKLVRASVY
jgi:hypothetical protein